MQIRLRGLMLGIVVVFLLACGYMEPALHTTPAPVETIRQIVDTAIAGSETASLADTSFNVPTLTATVIDIPLPLPTLTASFTPVPTMTATVVPTNTPPPIRLGPIGDLHLLPTPSGGDPGGFDTFRIEQAQVVPCHAARQFCEQGLSSRNPSQITLNASDSVCLFWIEHGSAASLGLSVEIYRGDTRQDKKDLQAVGNNVCRAGLLSPISAGDYETKFIYSDFVLSISWSIR